MPDGTFLRYVDRSFSKDTMDVITTVSKILDEYGRQNLVLTVRQVYYQMVARGFLPNNDRSYKRLGSIVSDARLAGLISWTAIEDRTRFLRGLEHCESVAEMLERARHSYRIDLWHNQPWRPEVWIEKDALVGVIEQICHELRVNYFACRGYSSQSEQWRAGQRLAGYVQRGQRPIIFHLGDHDPSGIDMTRDNQERLSMFAGTPIQVVRLALNMSQIEQYSPPPNPVKLTDSRSAPYRERFGDESWELDALEPRVLRDLIRDAVMRVRDAALWDAAVSEEVADLRYLDDVISEAGGGTAPDDEENDDDL